MIAQRFSSIGWVAGCAAAALCCYLASQSVASERAGLAKVDREIASATNDIRRLNTEIAARGRMGQIERWNRDVLALQAPAPGQFVADEVHLASLAGGRGLPLDPAVMATKGAVQTVAYQPNAPQPSLAPAPVSAEASAPAPVVQQPMLRTATFVRPKQIALDAPDSPIVKASLVRTKPFAADLDIDEPVKPKAPAPMKIVEPAKKVAVAKPDKTVAVTVAKAKTEAAKVAPTKAAPAKAAVAKAEPLKAAPLKIAALKPAVVKPAALTATLLPSDLGKLIAAEKKGAKPARTPADR
jgi:hypothetical protein